MTNVKRLGGETERQYVPKPSGGKRFSGMGFFLYIFVMGSLIFFAMTLRISYKDKAQNLNREIAHVKSQIHSLNREISVFKLRKETLCSPENISRKIQAYNLGLRHSNYSQVKRIVLRNGSGNGGVSFSEGNMKVSMR